MHYNKKNLALAVLFFVLALICAVSLFAADTDSYFITGLILFALIGIGFLRRSRMH